MLLVGFKQFLPGIAGPLPHDFGRFQATTGGGDFFRGAWDWFAVDVVPGEELLFREFLLPRVQGVFGRWDWLANGVLFATYHLHAPSAIPSALLDSIALAYSTRRFQSAWMGITVHSTQSVVILLLVLAIVLGQRTTRPRQALELRRRAGPWRETELGLVLGSA